MHKFNFSYDKENDDLFLFKPRSKSKGSIELGGLILDYNNKKELVGIQIIGASGMIRSITTKRCSEIKDILNHLERCKVESVIKNNLIILRISLISKSKEISPVFSIPSITNPRPALADV